MALFSLQNAMSTLHFVYLLEISLFLKKTHGFDKANN